MNINELPEEVLVRILSFLSPTDRLESALTCRRWARTVARAPPLLRDVWLVINRNNRLVINRTLKEAETVFANSHRQYENLRLERETPLDFNEAFWTNVGPGLRKLELLGFHQPPKVCYSILQTCSNLESLKICMSYRGVLPRELFELPTGINLGRIQHSMRNLRHLHLQSSVDADALEDLLILMPNVSSIALSCFYREPNFLSRLPEVLGASRKITALGLHYEFQSQDECEQFLRISSASLRTLAYNGPASTVLDELRNCSMLCDLDLRLTNQYDNRLLQNILQNVPELESLSIFENLQGAPTRREDLMPILNSRKLRNLHLDLKLVTAEDTFVPEEIVHDISRMKSLESLSLKRRVGTIDSARFQILASMPNLRELKLHNLQWNAECLRTVLFDLGKLKMLEIDGYVPRRLTCIDDRTISRDRHCEPERNTLNSQDRQGEPKFSSLEVLSINDIPLTDACIGRITSYHNQLRIVHLHGTDITDAGLETLFQHEPHLEKLKSGSLDKGNGRFLEGLGKLCPRLRSLDVHFPCKISSQAVEEFKSRRPRVKCSFF